MSEIPLKPPEYAKSLTDTGNAQRLVKLHGNDIRYCHKFRSWYVWDGRRWCPDDEEKILIKATDTVNHIYDEVKYAKNKDERNAILQHAHSSYSGHRLKMMTTLAQSLVPISPDRFDQQIWKFNCMNGTINLKTGVLEKHDKKDLITKISNVPYLPDAECPVFDAFLERIFDGDQDLIGFLGRMMAYTLSGSTGERVMFILHGSGDNGKSKLVEIIAEIMGEYAKTITPEALMMKREEASAQPEIAGLRGIRFVYTSETEENKRLAIAKIKKLTGDETITARHLFQEPFEFKPEGKIWFSSNFKPKIGSGDSAIWRRIRLLPFNVKIPEPQQDKELFDKFKEEKAGILSFAVRHLDQYHKYGLAPAKASFDATESYKLEEDTVARFIDEMCVIKHGATVTVKDLYQNYTEWCDASGERALYINKFSSSVSTKGFDRDTTGKVRYFNGLGLVCEGYNLHEAM